MRGYIPKADGRQRPIGIPVLEDKIVQRATVQVLNANCEVDFLGFSYGFRPGRSCHQALDALAVGIQSRKVSYILDADIRGFFDSLDHEWLIKFVEHRIADRRVIRHIRKWLNAGVLEKGQRIEQEEGVPQGGSVSPLLVPLVPARGYVFDVWAEQWRHRQARGDVIIVRYADDFVVGFQHRSDADESAGPAVCEADGRLDGRNDNDMTPPFQRPALELADVIERHGHRLENLSGEQQRILRAIASCRTAALGGHVETCDHCHYRRVAYNSCRNRHCPKCQASACARWMGDRAEELLPVEYFHVVFTLPDTFNALALANKRVVYSVLFDAVGQTLLEVAANPKHLGAKIGFMSILHTWGQNLCLHPHVHCVVPGGGLSPDGSKWISCRPGFFLPVRVTLQSLPRQVHRSAQTRTQERQADRRGERQCLPAAAGCIGQTRLGRLRQAALRRPRAGAQVPGPLHPPHRHLQPKTRGDG
jgi:hypothetical protein